MKKSGVCLGDLLNAEQKKMLTTKARKLTHNDLTKMQSDPTLGGKLSKKDHASVIKLALHRANHGQTVFTYSHMQFDTDEVPSDTGSGGSSNW